MNRSRDERPVPKFGTNFHCHWRPIRFTVSQFDHKRQILKANNLLRKSEDVVYSNIYFTPDLTKNQRKQAYELRVERRTRENNGETDLKISRGKIVTVKETKRDEREEKGYLSGALPPVVAFRLSKTTRLLYIIIMYTCCTVVPIEKFI